MGTVNDNDLAHLEKFPDENPNPMLRIAFSGQVLYANAAGRRLLRYGDELQVPNTWLALLHTLLKHPENAELEHYHADKVYSCIFVPVVHAGYANVYGIDITERKQMENALRSSEEQLRSLIASIVDVVFSIGLDGRILVYHEGADTSHDTPITPSRLFIGKQYADVLPGEMAEPLAQAVEQVKATYQTEQFVYSLQLDRELRYFSARVSPLIAPNIRLMGFTVVASDITAATLARQRQQRLLEIEQLQRTITSMFLQTDDLDEALNHVQALVGQSLDVSRVYTFHMDEHRVVFDNTYEWCAPGVSSQRIYLQDLALHTLVPSWLPLLSENGMIAPFEDVSELPPDVQNFLEQKNIETLLVLPLNVDNRLQGFIGFDEVRYPRQWQPEEIATLRTLTESYARMLERYNARRELIRARDAALQSARLKSEFLSNISHEIRTPLTQLLSTLDLLGDTRLEDMQCDLLSSASVSARHLFNVISDVLDFSRLETGKMGLDIESFDVRVIVRDIITTLQPQARRKQIALTTHIDRHIPAPLLGDPARLRQVLNNLVSNGIKFTPTGSVQLHVKQVKANTQYTTLRFSVIDTGIGIAREQQRYIFNSFVQADGSSTRRYNGTGLGLSIAQQLVQLMGGNISVRSNRGQGSAFEFTLTLRIAP